MKLTAPPNRAVVSDQTGQHMPAWQSWFSQVAAVLALLTNNPAQLQSYTLLSLPSAAPAGQLIYVSNATGGAITAFSDGTNFRRTSDRSIIN